MDKFNAIKVFCRVVELKSFTKAADSLDMPKTTVSKLVGDLEATLQVRLLSRTTRSVQPTPEGEAYYAKTSHWLRELDEIDSAFGAGRIRPRGRVQVALSAWVASDIVIPRLHEFHERYPGIQIELNVSDRPSHLILDNADCAIRGGVLSDMSMIGRLIGQSRFIAAATPGYLAKYGVPRHPLELNDGHYLIGYQFAGTGRTIPFRFKRSNEELDIAGEWIVSVNEGNAHLAAGLNGLGVITGFEWKLRPYLADGSLVQILEGWQASDYPFHLVYPPNKYRNLRVRVVIDWLVDLFAQLDKVVRA